MTFSSTLDLAKIMTGEPFSVAQQTITDRNFCNLDEAEMFNFLGIQELLVIWGMQSSRGAGPRIPLDRDLKT